MSPTEPQPASPSARSLSADKFSIGGSFRSISCHLCATFRPVLHAFNRAESDQYRRFGVENPRCLYPLLPLIPIAFRGMGKPPASVHTGGSTRSRDSPRRQGLSVDSIHLDFVSVSTSSITIGVSRTPAPESGSELGTAEISHTLLRGAFASLNSFNLTRPHPRETIGDIEGPHRGLMTPCHRDGSLCVKVARLRNRSDRIQRV